MNPGAAEALEFAGALLRSPTFWAETAPLAGGALALLVFGAWRLARVARRRRSPWRAFAAAEHGSAEAMDFVLTFPIAMLVGFLFVQLLLGANASLVVHHAAYAAARAARTSYFDMTILDVRALQAPSALLNRPLWQRSLSNNGPRARQRADRAARLALMAAVPSAIRMPASAGGTSVALTRGLAALPVAQGPARRKAAYVYAPGNCRVQVGVVRSFEQRALAGALAGLRIVALPVYARVSFRYPLVMPGSSALFASRTYTMNAEVTLL